MMGLAENRNNYEPVETTGFAGIKAEDERRIDKNEKPGRHRLHDEHLPRTVAFYQRHCRRGEIR
jgi:hypothetical protein